MKQALLIVGVLAGGVVGYFSAHYFALWGGIALLGEPHSPARDALVPGHVLFGAAFCGVLGYFLGQQLDISDSKIRAGNFLKGQRPNPISSIQLGFLLVGSVVPACVIFYFLRDPSQPFDRVQGLFLFFTWEIIATIWAEILRWSSIGEPRTRSIQGPV